MEIKQKFTTQIRFDSLSVGDVFRELTNKVVCIKVDVDRFWGGETVQRISTNTLVIPARKATLTVEW